MFARLSYLAINRQFRGSFVKAIQTSKVGNEHSISLLFGQSKLAFSSSIYMADGAAAGMAALSVGQSPVEAKLPYYKKRVEVFEQLYVRELAKLEAAKAANEQIKVVMPDGKERQAVKGVTTPMDIAKEISSSLAKKVIVADADGRPWDLLRPLEGDCALKLFSFEDAEGRDVSSSWAEGVPGIAPWRAAFRF